MPTNVELFDMLEPGILAGMTKEQLRAELDRASQMREAVMEYRLTIIELMGKNLTPTSHSSVD